MLTGVPVRVRSLEANASVVVASCVASGILFRLVHSAGGRGRARWARSRRGAPRAEGGMVVVVEPPGEVIRRRGERGTCVLDDRNPWVVRSPDYHHRWRSPVPEPPCLAVIGFSF